MTNAADLRRMAHDERYDISEELYDALTELADEFEEREPYVPPAPPSNWTKAKWWFNRVILRKKHGISLSTFDRVLRETYAPGLRAEINRQNTLMTVISKDANQRKGQHAVWAIPDEVGG